MASMQKWTRLGRRILGGALVAGWLLGSAPALADAKTFDSLYEEAVRLKKAGRYQEAIQKYAQARNAAEPGDVHRTVMAMWGIGTTYELMRDCPNAIATWEEYIRYAEGKAGESGGIKNAQEKIAVCKKQIELRQQ